MSGNRGAPTGNKNALKHGFYSAEFKKKERLALQAMPLTDLTPEIELLRAANLRFLQFMNSNATTPNLEMQLTLLRAVSLSTQAIRGIVRMQGIRALADREASEIVRQLQADWPEDSAEDN